MRSLLEDTKVADITAAELDGLVGREENQRLELKETLEGTDAYELAKDLSSMANAEGGYLVVGAIQDKRTERCTGFRSVRNADPVFKKIKDIAAEHIQKRLAIEPVLRTTNTGENLVLAPVPKSFQVLAVISDGRTEYWIRVGRDKRRMRHDEIEAAFLKKLTIAPQETERQRRLAEDVSRWDQITIPEILWEVLDRRFEDEVGTQKYLRLTSTPEDLREDRVDTADDNLRNFLWQNDFNLSTGESLNPLVSTALGWESEHLKKFGFPLIWNCLTRTGHYEIWVPLFGMICHGQDERDVQQQPWLQPLAVIEFPVRFLRFVKSLYSKIGVNSQIVARMQYRNLKGGLLPPSSGQGLIRYPMRPFADEHYQPHDVRFGADFDPDEVALRFLQRLYRKFGYEKNNIPYFVNGRFEPRGAGTRL